MVAVPRAVVAVKARWLLLRPVWLPFGRVVAVKAVWLLRRSCGVVGVKARCWFRAWWCCSGPAHWLRLRLWVGVGRQRTDRATFVASATPAGQAHSGPMALRTRMFWPYATLAWFYWPRAPLGQVRSGPMSHQTTTRSRPMTLRARTPRATLAQAPFWPCGAQAHFYWPRGTSGHHPLGVGPAC